MYRPSEPPDAPFDCLPPPIAISSGPITIGVATALVTSYHSTRVPPKGEGMGVMSRLSRTAGWAAAYGLNAS